MRRRIGLALSGLAILASVWMLSCSRPTTPTVGPLAATLSAPSATLAETSVAFTPTATPRDESAPLVLLGDLPESVLATDGLKVVATSSDDMSVARMALSVDGVLVHEAIEATLRFNVDTPALGSGQHELRVQAWDEAGNVGEARHLFRVVVPSSATPSATLAPTKTHTHTPTPRATPLPTPTVVTPVPAPTAEAVVAYWDEMSIATYGYEHALYDDPEGSGQPYPLLHSEQVSGPVERRYRVLVLRNRYLQVTLLPELGGRIYQVRFLPTGQDLLYNNKVIKPTHWGPLDQGWWLAVGGIEFCLPVDEHGYLTAEPWETTLVTGRDGSATAVMSIVERSRNLRAQVQVTLRPGEAGVRLRTGIENPDVQAKQFQYWVNAMLSPGAHGVQPSLRFYYPTDGVTVHSRGDAALPDAGNAMPWPLYDGRDLSDYGTWRNWLGFFATELRSNYTAVYDTAARVGMVRTFPDEATGAKLFGFGSGFDPGVYTDDGTRYVEMWGGLTPTFWDYATLDGQGRRVWDEYWYVLAGVDGLAAANEQSALWLTREQGGLRVTVASPGEHTWVLSLWQGEREIGQWPCVVRPDAPCTVSAAGDGWNPSDAVIVRVLDQSGQVLLSHAG